MSGAGGSGGLKIIYYHGTPTGGTRVESGRFLAGRHALVPFVRPDDLPAVMDVCQSFVLDNSAYSVWKQGGQVDFAAYAEWVRSVHRHPGFDWAVIPDVIDGTEQDNDALLRDWPADLRGVPVYHYHESLDRLARLVRDWPTVALGSSGEWPTPGTESWWARTSEIMAVCCDPEGRPLCRLHGLRMLNPEIFRRLPLASADSTNAVRNANLVRRFGMYAPPNLSQRMDVIAARIEAEQSAPCWLPAAAERDLFTWEA